MTKVNCPLVRCIHYLEGICQLDEITLNDDVDSEGYPWFNCANEERENHKDEGSTE